MKITRIKLENFQGNRTLDVALPNQPVILVCGHNWSGKSTLLDAVRYALIGRTVKTGIVAPPRNGVLLTNEATEGTVRIEGTDGQHPFQYTRSLHNGVLIDAESKPNTNVAHRGAVPALFPAYFSSLDADQRRELLWQCKQGGSPQGIDVNDLVAGLRNDAGEMPFDEQLAHACATEADEHLIAGGFAAAHKEAQLARQSAKGEWKGITGQTWGPQKAAHWAPAAADATCDEQIELHKKSLEQKRNQLKILEQQLEASRQAEKTHDAYHHASVARSQAMDKISSLHKALAEIKSDGERYAKLLKELQTNARSAQIEQAQMPCPHCNTMLRYTHRDPRTSPQLVRNDEHFQPITAEQRQKLKTHIEAMSAKLADARSVYSQIKTQIDAEQKRLQDTPAAETEPPMIPAGEVEQIAQQLERERAECETLNSELHRWIGRRNAQGDDQLEQRAQHAHQRILIWDRIAELTGPGPNGFMARATQEALTDLNGAVHYFGRLLKEVWPEEILDQNLNAFAYDSMSVSERWLVDLAISAALGRGNSRLLLVDELDIISPEARPRVFNALAQLVRLGHYDQIIACCTLRKAPSLPEKGPLGLVWLPKMNHEPVQNLLVTGRWAEEKKNATA